MGRYRPFHALPCVAGSDDYHRFRNLDSFEHIGGNAAGELQTRVWNHGGGTGFCRRVSLSRTQDRVYGLSQPGGIGVVETTCDCRWPDRGTAHGSWGRRDV